MTLGYLQPRCSVHPGARWWQLITWQSNRRWARCKPQPFGEGSLKSFSTIHDIMTRWSTRSLSLQIWPDSARMYSSQTSPFTPIMHYQCYTIAIIIPIMSYHILSFSSTPCSILPKQHSPLRVPRSLPRDASFWCSGASRAPPSVGPPLYPPWLPWLPWLPWRWCDVLKLWLIGQKVHLRMPCKTWTKWTLVNSIQRYVKGVCGLWMVMPNYQSHSHAWIVTSSYLKPSCQPVLPWQDVHSYSKRVQCFGQWIN